MTPHPRRLLVWGGALALVQGALVGGYLLGSRRGEVPFDPGSVATGARVPPLACERPDGRRDALAASPGRPQLLHVWATWCPPCREELPSILALARARRDVDVAAVSFDPGWAPITAFLDGDVPPQVLRAVDPGEEAWKALEMAQMPVTFLVSPEGRLLRRYDGPRAWSSPEAAAHLERVLGASR